MTHKAIVIWNLPGPWASCLAVFLTGPLSQPYRAWVLFWMYHILPPYCCTLLYMPVRLPAESSRTPYWVPLRISPPPCRSDTCLSGRLSPSLPSRSWGLSPAPLALTTALQLFMSVSVLSRADPCFIHLCVLCSITNNGRCFLKDCWVNECLD